MADTKKILEGLQIIVTDLAQQADGHAIQSKIFAAQSFSKLGEKYAEHATEERGYVDKCIDRILDLGGEVKNGAKKEAPVYTDVIEWIKYDLQVSKDGLAWLKTLVEEARDDYTTFDILKEYYQDEEEDMYWGQAQLEMIECIGVQNWLLQQM
ncbi:MAG TPA: ferritin-like domain-containing protein [Ruminococcus flavefaciens]|nr:ferritin-like domain-containing protein [Ruminococcus flavefaciens]